MSILIGIVIGISAVAEQPATAVPPAEDRIICKRSEHSETGSRMSPPRVCKRKSQWAFEESETQRMIQKVGSRHTGTPSDGRRD